VKILLVVFAIVGTSVFLGTQFHFHECGRHSFLMHVSRARRSCGPTERPAHICLKTLASAQAEFRANDRDGNGKPDFWRGDVAGLYRIKSSKLIEISVAAADDRPTEPIETLTPRAPKSGYWFRAIRHAGETAPDPARFAFCAFPARYPTTGRWTFILDEGNTVFRRDLGRPGGIEVFPDDEELRREWSKLD